MITIPLQISKTQYDLFVILECENIQRIQAYDPAEVALEKLPSVWRKMTPRCIQICYAAEVELKRVMSATNVVEVVEQLKVLARGWQFKPERGDSDAPYQIPTKN